MGRKRVEADLTTYSGRVAHRLRALRDEKKWSVEDLAKRLKKRGVDVTETTLYRYETGQHLLPPDLYPHIAAVFGITIHELLPPD